jgi:predicted nuclease of predicted toxin-antitoxin system
MIFFLDENFPKIAKSILESRNHKVYDIRGTDKEGLSDSNIFAISIKNRAIFLTTDKDFFQTIHFMFKPHYGIVIIALSKPNTNNIINKLNWFLREFTDQNIENKCFLIKDNKCNIYN